MTPTILVKQEALNFLSTCIRKGLCHSYDTISEKWVKAYPEVTGYVLSLFCRFPGFDHQAHLIARRLKRLQRPHGGYRSFHGTLTYVFDTAQICKGLLDWYEHTGEQAALTACLKGLAFLRKMEAHDGALFPIYNESTHERVAIGSNWGNSFTTINCKCVEFLQKMNALGFLPDRSLGDRIVSWTASQPQLLYTHPAAYVLEGLLAWGQRDLVAERLEKFFLPRVSENGFIPYHPDLDYAYVSGSVQLAILLAKTGNRAVSLKIFNWARKVQERHNSGGLFQYAYADGTLCGTIHSEINSWGTKYYVELADILSNGESKPAGSR